MVLIIAAASMTLTGSTWAYEFGGQGRPGFPSQLPYDRPTLNVRPHSPDLSPNHAPRVPPPGSAAQFAKEMAKALGASFLHTHVRGRQAMNVLLRAIWAPTDETQDQLAHKFLRFIDSMAEVDARLSDWRKKIVGEEEAAPLLAAHTPHAANETLLQGSRGTLRIKGVERPFGYGISGWTGDETCGADFDLNFGIGKIGIPAPNSLKLNLVGILAQADLRRLFTTVMEALNADAGDVTTDDFLDLMLDCDQGIVAPSGGILAYIRHGEISHARATSVPAAGGSLITLGGNPDPSSSSWFDEASELHEALAPWRADPTNVPGMTPPLWVPPS